MRLQNIARFLRPSLVCTAVAAVVLLTWGDGSSAGIQGTGRLAVRAVGRITAFGSIFVDGIEYSLAQAQIQIDGGNATAGQLRIGQIVNVQGVTTSANAGSASNVTFNGDVVGPVSQVDPAGNAFTVLGQTVKIDDSTLFGDGIQPAGLAALTVGTNVEVSAFTDASGNLLASRVDLQTPGTALQVQGAVEGLNAAAKTFQINDLKIDYSQASVSGTVANATTALVWADEYPTAGTLHVTRVQISDGIGGSAGEQGHLEGLVTSISSASSFYIGTQLVVTNSSTNFVLHGQTLAPNVEVRVHGTFDATGALVAKQVMGQPPGHQ